MRTYVRTGQYVRIKYCFYCGEPLHVRYGASQMCIICRKKRGQFEAIDILSKALVRGLLPYAKTLKCKDCGKPAAHYDHRDYAYPLKVEPVCRSCNRKRGPAWNSLVFGRLKTQPCATIKPYIIKPRTNTSK